MTDQLNEICIGSRNPSGALDRFCDAFARRAELVENYSRTSLTALPDGRRIPDLNRQSRQAVEQLARSHPNSRAALDTYKKG